MGSPPPVRHYAIFALVLAFFSVVVAVFYTALTAFPFRFTAPFAAIIVTFAVGSAILQGLLSSDNED